MRESISVLDQSNVYTEHCFGFVMSVAHESIAGFDTNAPAVKASSLGMLVVNSSCRENPCPIGGIDHPDLHVRQSKHDNGCFFLSLSRYVHQ